MALCAVVENQNMHSIHMIHDLMNLSKAVFQVRVLRHVWDRPLKGIGGTKDWRLASECYDSNTFYSLELHTGPFR